MIEKKETEEIRYVLNLIGTLRYVWKGPGSSGCLITYFGRETRREN